MKTVRAGSNAQRASQAVAQLLRSEDTVLVGATSVLRLPKCPETRCRSHTARLLFWSDQVSSAHEFYGYADEHFGWAETVPLHVSILPAGQK